jgi:hypothetical protein
MIITGVDYHPSDQYIAFVDTETGECRERRLNHSDKEAEKFYRELAARRLSVRVGMEATGYSRWFKRLLAELGIEVWIGDAAAKEHRPGGHGPKTCGSDVLDVAKRLGICAVGQVRFERGTARHKTWRELERRPLDWASRSLARGSLNE